MNVRGILILSLAAAVLMGAASGTKPNPQTQPAATPPASAAAGTTWEVEGVMADACQCEVFCPCEFLSTPTHGHCDDAAVLLLSKGRYKDVDLAGLRVVVVSASREGKRIIDTVGDLEYARIFVPQGSTDAQTEALAQVARNVFGAFVGTEARVSPDESVEKVPIQISAESHHYKVTIPGILEMDLHSETGGDGVSPIVLKNNAFAAMGAGDAEVAKSSVYRYTKDGKNWDYAGRSASIRPFKMKG